VKPCSSVDTDVSDEPAVFIFRTEETLRKEAADSFKTLVIKVHGVTSQMAVTIS
jgi:hypothetical protein